jgi:hypothetical protein
MKTFTFMLLIMSATVGAVLGVTPPTDFGNMYRSGPGYWTYRFNATHGAANLASTDAVGMRSMVGIVFARPDTAIQALYISGLRFSDGRPTCTEEEIGLFRYEATFAFTDTLYPRVDMTIPAGWSSPVLQAPHNGKPLIEFYASYEQGWQCDLLDFVNYWVADGGNVLIRIVHEGTSGVFVDNPQGPVIQYSFDETSSLVDIGIGAGSEHIKYLVDPTGFDGLICQGMYRTDEFSSARMAICLQDLQGNNVVRKYMMLPILPTESWGEFSFGVASEFFELYPTATLQIMPVGYSTLITCTADSSITLTRNTR